MDSFGNVLMLSICKTNMGVSKYQNVECLLVLMDLLLFMIGMKENK